MLTLILGTDWIANKNEILRLIAQDVGDRKGGRILVVPELTSHDTERLLCSAAGDTASRYAEVVSFTRLARRVSDKVGHAVPECLDNGGRVVAMAAAARQLHSKIKVYASLETRPEFITGLVEAIDEFKRCCIFPKDLLEASKRSEGTLAQKLEELSFLYESYDALCQQGKRDPRDQMNWLLEELEESGFAREHVFYIEGFPDFTRQHMAILEHIIQSGTDITVSLNCDKPGSKAVAFEKAGETALELLRFAQQYGIAVDVQTVASREDPLSTVMEKLFQGKLNAQIPDSALRLYRTETVYQECLCAAKQIMESVRLGDRYRDTAVVCADIGTYKNALSIVFDRCHIPVYISGTEEILGRPVVAAVLLALDTAIGGFEQQSVLSYLKSILSPLDLTTADKIENYAVIWGINGSRWLDRWNNHPDGLSGKWNDDTQSVVDELNISKNLVLEPLFKLRERFRSAVNLSQQVLALYHFFDAIHLSERLDTLAQQLELQGDYREAQVLNQLWEILLTALEQMHDVLGDTTWETEGFTRLFKLLLSQYDVGTIPPVLDAVTVGPISAMRCHQVKHVLVLGAQEGALPSYGGSVGILTDQERIALRRLGVNLTGGAIDGLQAEFAEIYGVFCGAQESITVSCPSGQPSFIYRRLAAITKEVQANWQLCTPMGDSVEAGAYLARFNADRIADNLGISEQYQQVARSKVHTIGNVDRDSIEKLYGRELFLSASQIDRQAECRLSYFLRYGLKTNERKEATVDPAEFGTYVHAVLENTAKKIKELGGYQKVSLEEAVQIAQQFSEEYAAERFGTLDTQRISYLFNRNARELELIVEELWREMHTCRFEPLAFELGFGGSEDMPAIRFHGESMKAQLRGFVDRVDVWKSENQTYFRVVDYKTGKKDFDYCDIFNGLGLQMLLYLFALEQEGKDLLGADAQPAGVQYFPARVPLVPADGKLTEAEALAEREKLWKRKGLLLSDEKVLSAMESEDAPNRMPYSRRKDGSLSGDLADRRQFCMLRDYVYGLVEKMIDEIASGCVEPNPYTRGSSHNACTYCPYSAICHLETVDGRRNYMTMTAQRFWDEVQKEVSERG